MSWDGERAVVTREETGYFPNYVSIVERRDKEPPSNASATPLPGGIAMVYHVPAKAIARLGGMETLTIGVPLTSGKTGVAVFHVEQFEEALKLLGAACNFR
jgi:hypothetical protein